MAPPPVELSFVKASPASITFELHGRGAERSALHRHLHTPASPSLLALCQREARPHPAYRRLARVFGLSLALTPAVHATSRVQMRAAAEAQPLLLLRLVDLRLRGAQAGQVHQGQPAARHRLPLPRQGLRARRVGRVGRGGRVADAASDAAAGTPTPHTTRTTRTAHTAHTTHTTAQSRSPTRPHHTRSYTALGTRTPAHTRGSAAPGTHLSAPHVPPTAQLQLLHKTGDSAPRVELTAATAPLPRRLAPTCLRPRASHPSCRLTGVLGVTQGSSGGGGG